MKFLSRSKSDQKTFGGETLKIQFRQQRLNFFSDAIDININVDAGADVNADAAGNDVDIARRCEEEEHLLNFKFCGRRLFWPKFLTNRSSFAFFDLVVPGFVVLEKV